MKPLALLLAALAFSAAANAAVVLRVTPSGKDRIDVRAENASLHALAGAIGMKLKVPVTVDLPDRSVDFSAISISPSEALVLLAQKERLRIVDEEGALVLRDAAEATVTLDVKDAHAGEILRTVASQCGIRNLVIDPGVEGKGTFLFDHVPCGVAIRTVLRTLGLAGDIMPNSVVRVTH